MELYTSEKVNDNLTCIRSKSGELMYLIEGDKQCALIDSCFGAGHLKDYVKTLTDKPVALFLTHGHVDHAMGAPEFDRVFMNEKDKELYRSQCSMEERSGYAHALLGEAADELDGEYTAEEPDKEFEKLEDGMVFEIAPFHLEAYAFPGHTKGMMIFLIREMGILIVGDACNNATFIFDEESAPLEEYKALLEKNIQRLAGKFDHVFLSHHVMEAPVDVMEQVLEVCEEALQGNAEDVPFEFMGSKAFIAKKCNERFEREDGKFGNIVYDKEKL